MISKTIQRSFPSLIQQLKQSNPYDKFLFSSNFSGSDLERYQGSYFCGEMCFRFKKILDAQGIPNRVYKSLYLKYIDQNYISDHSFIILDNNQIFDPTYKQFMIDSELSSNSNYLKWIFQENPPYFLGTKQELISYLTISHQKYLQEYSKVLNTPVSILPFWNKDLDVTSQFIYQK